MRRFAFIFALGLGFTSAAYAAPDVPATNPCIWTTSNEYGTIHINCPTLATYIAGSMTKPSPGHSIYGVKASQTNGTGWGNSAELRMKIRGRNYGGMLFSDTPTNCTLWVPTQGRFSWPLRRYEFDLLWTYQFSAMRHRVVPYVTAGGGAIALNGGSASGWDRQAALVEGAGSDVRVTRLITLRAGFTMDSLKASTYSDPDYRSRGTIMVEPRIGLVWGFGWPHP